MRFLSARAALAFAILFASVVPSALADITVDDDGPADYDNIQEAIDNATPGETILVAPGVLRRRGRDPHFGDHHGLGGRDDRGPCRHRDLALVRVPSSTRPLGFSEYRRPTSRSLLSRSTVTTRT